MVSLSNSLAPLAQVNQGGLEFKYMKHFVVVEEDLYNKEAGTLTFSTNQFSTYALMLLEVNDNLGGEKPSESPSEEPSEEVSEEPSEEPSEAPSTKDNMLLYWNLFIMIVGVGVFLFGTKQILNKEI